MSLANRSIPDPATDHRCFCLLRKPMKRNSAESLNCLIATLLTPLAPGRYVDATGSVPDSPCGHMQQLTQRHFVATAALPSAAAAYGRGPLNHVPDITDWATTA